MIYHFRVGAHKHILKMDGPEITRVCAHPSQFNAFTELARAGQPGSFQACSMSAFDKDKAVTPDYILDRMVEIKDWKPEAGGFMDVNEPMIAALACGTFPSDFTPDEQYCSFCSMHPFIEECGHFAFGMGISHKLMQLLNYIYDIRRFRDAEGVSTLVSDFSLSQPSHLFRVFKTGKVDKPSLRPAMAFNAWQVVDLKEVDAEWLKDRPGAWVHREYLNLREELRPTIGEGCDQLAQYRTTVRFLQYLEKLWTVGLGLDTFDPEDFFTFEQDAKVYREIIK